MIPKIIHQIMPSDKNRWHSLWEPCSESWRKQFSGFTFMYWKDDELHTFIEKEYPQFYDTFKSFPFNIMRIDFARYCILHKYGGIYADMDMFCYKNFYEVLSDYDMFLPQSTTPGCLVENSMIATKPNLEFFIDCAISSEKTFNINKHIDAEGIFDNKSAYCSYVTNITGINLLSNVYDYFKDDQSLKIGLLDFNLFLGDRNHYSPKLFTRHMCSDSWGGFDREPIDVKTFDFYKNYTESV
jgi:hypothetical protein